MWYSFAFDLTSVYLFDADNNTEIVVEKTSETGDYADFLNQLPQDEPRYAINDFEYEKPGEGLRSKIVFYSW